MCLGLKRYYGLYILDYEPIGCGVIGRSKLLYNRTLCECHVVLVGREDAVGVLLCGLLDKTEQ